MREPSRFHAIWPDNGSVRCIVATSMRGASRRQTKFVCITFVVLQEEVKQDHNKLVHHKPRHESGVYRNNTPFREQAALRRFLLTVFLDESQQMLITGVTFSHCNSFLSACQTKKRQQRMYHPPPL